MPDNQPVIWVVHAQLMSLLRDEEIVALVETLKPDAVIADEIHVFKTREMKLDESVELKPRSFSLSSQN